MRYNEIEEQYGYYVLWKNPELAATDSEPMAFKDMFIEWGQEGTKVKIRRLLYPKENYSRSDIERIAQATINCPFCKEGKSTINTPNSPQLEAYAPIHLSPLPNWSEIVSKAKQDWNKFWENLF